MSKLDTLAAQARRIAIAAPCQHAMQCADPRYFRCFYPRQGLRVGMVITVNVGEE